jgi:predicted nicotinamide N-methyase
MVEYNMLEYLVTGQGYATNDTNKQLILLHDTVFAHDANDAIIAFEEQFKSTYKILKVFSATNLSLS